MKKCHHLGEQHDNIAPRTAKAARKLIGRVVTFMYNWDVNSAQELLSFRVGRVQDVYFNIIKINGEWSMMSSVLEMRPATTLTGGPENEQRTGIN